jgi:hypothetical protein
MRGAPRRRDRFSLCFRSRAGLRGRPFNARLRPVLRAASPRPGPCAALPPCGAARSRAYRAGCATSPSAARIHRVEAELIEQTSHRGFGLVIVPCDDERATILRAGRLAVGGERCGVDMIEGFDDLRGWKVLHLPAPTERPVKLNQRQQFVPSGLGKSQFGVEQIAVGVQRVQQRIDSTAVSDVRQT